MPRTRRGSLPTPVESAAAARKPRAVKAKPTKAKVHGPVPVRRVSTRRQCTAEPVEDAASAEDENLKVLESVEDSIQTTDNATLEDESQVEEEEETTKEPADAMKARASRPTRNSRKRKVEPPELAGADDEKATEQSLRHEDSHSEVPTDAIPAEVKETPAHLEADKVDDEHTKEVVAVETATETVSKRQRRSSTTKTTAEEAQAALLVSNVLSSYTQQSTTTAQSAIASKPAADKKKKAKRKSLKTTSDDQLSLPTETTESEGGKSEQASLEAGNGSPEKPVCPMSALEFLAQSAIVAMDTIPAYAPVALSSDAASSEQDPQQTAEADQISVIEASSVTVPQPEQAIEKSASGNVDEPTEESKLEPVESALPVSEDAILEKEHEPVIDLESVHEPTDDIATKSVHDNGPNDPTGDAAILTKAPATDELPASASDSTLPGDGIAEPIVDTSVRAPTVDEASTVDSKAAEMEVEVSDKQEADSPTAQDDEVLLKDGQAPGETDDALTPSEPKPIANNSEEMCVAMDVEATTPSTSGMHSLLDMADPTKSDETLTPKSISETQETVEAATQELAEQDELPSTTNVETETVLLVRADEASASQAETIVDVVHSDVSDMNAEDVTKQPTALSASVADVVDVGGITLASTDGEAAVLDAVPLLTESASMQTHSLLSETLGVDESNLIDSVQEVSATDAVESMRRATEEKAAASRPAFGDLSSTVDDKSSAPAIHFDADDHGTRPVVTQSSATTAKLKKAISILPLVVNDRLSEADVPPPKTIRILNLDRVKLAIYHEGRRCHKGRGYEKAFAGYWSAISLCLERYPTKANTQKCQATLNAFLTTRKLRKLHNAMIVGLLERCMRSRSLIDTVDDHIPASLRDKVSISTLQNLKEANVQPVSPTSLDSLTSNEKLETSADSSMALDLTYRERDAPLIVVSDAAPPDTRLRPLLASSCIPGALAIDPYVRSLASIHGMRVSENAVWLLVVAIKEFTSSCVRQMVDASKAAATVNIPPADRIPSLYSGLQKRGRSNEIIESPTKKQKSGDTMYCFGAFDVHTLVTAMAARSSMSAGESFARAAFESSLHSSAHHGSVGQDSADFQSVKGFICKKLSVFTPAKETEPPVSINVTAAAAAADPELGDRRSPVVPGGLGRGAKSIASLQLKAKSVKNEGSNVPDSSDANPALTLSAVPDPLGTGPQSAVPDPLAKASPSRQGIEGNPQATEQQIDEQQSARRGMGFGVKNLAAMRARSAALPLTTIEASAAVPQEAIGVPETAPASAAAAEYTDKPDTIVGEPSHGNGVEPAHAIDTNDAANQPTTSAPPDQAE